MKAPDLVHYSGISYRQLDYWTSRGYLKTYHDSNPGSGTAREYPFDQAKKARLMLCLITLGFEVHLAEKISAFAVLGEYKLHLGHGVTLLIEDHEHKDGKKK
jgi:DNA-binding transcriptional MerR regulator